MIDYARISTMVRYATSTGMRDAPPTPLRRVKDAAKILLGAGPVATPYGEFARRLAAWDIFRAGTRGWEYPWVLDRLAALPAGAEILDGGCGASAFPEMLARRGFRPTGLDRFDRGDGRAEDGIPLSHRKRYAGTVRFVDGDLHDIPLASETFDAVSCISVMEHIVISHRHAPAYHLRCLDEMKRILRPGGLLVCTYDTILHPGAVFAGTPEWGEDGWYYMDDIDYLRMEPQDPDVRPVTREEILQDEDAFFVPPDIYFADGYGAGFELEGRYHRLTSVGFALVKPRSAVGGTGCDVPGDGSL